MPLSASSAGKNIWSPLEAAQAPEDVHQPERAEEDAAPQVEGALELRRPAHHEQRLQLAELLAGQQLSVRDAADVGEAAGEVVDLARRRIALAGFGEERRERREAVPRARPVRSG